MGLTFLSLLCVLLCYSLQSFSLINGSNRAKPSKQRPAASNQKHTEVILASLITSKTRLKLLLKFFTHPDAQGHLRGLAEEFGDSTNSVRIELNKLEEAGLLRRQVSGQKMVYQVNKSNPFYFNLVSMVSKYLGFDELIESLLEQVGDLKEAYVVGDYARGVDSGTIELILVGQLHAEVVDDLVDRVSKRINRRIIYKVMETENSTIPMPQLRLI